MGYWLVVAIAAIAVLTVLIAVATEPETPEIPKRERGARPVWLAMGTSGNPPGNAGESVPPGWVDHIEDALGPAVIPYDFTRAGCTAEEAQREELAAAVAIAPDIVSILLGPDDFRDAEDLGSFERRLWHILTSLRDAGCIPVLASLPDLTSLPSLAEEDREALAEELRSWNAAIARLTAAAGGEFVGCPTDPAGDLFTEEGSRYILTTAGHRWFASLMGPAVQRLLGIVDEAASHPSSETEGERE